MVQGKAGRAGASRLVTGDIASVKAVVDVGQWMMNDLAIWATATREKTMRALLDQE